MENTAQAAEVRKWALAQGITVGKRGRLSKNLFDQYAAHRNQNAL